MKTLNQQFLEWSIGHSVTLARLSDGEARRWGKLIETTVWPDVVARMERVSLKSRGIGSDVFNTRQYRQSLADMRGIFKDGFAGAKKDFENRLVAVGNKEAEELAKVFARLMPVNVSFDLPSAGTIRQIVTGRPFENHLLKEWVNGLSSSAMTRATKVINAGMIQGQSIPQIAKGLREAAKISGSEARTIARTAVNHISSQTRQETFAENQDLIKEVKWVSTLDARTTSICRALDGRVYPVLEGPRPPAHFNCRSTVVPIVKSWEELGIKGLKDLPASTRASMDGQVPADMSFKEWALTKTPAQRLSLFGTEDIGKIVDTSLVEKALSKPFTLRL